jgi:dipeptidyl aminopeptidase/acylaminoacyl peptidase
VEDIESWVAAFQRATRETGPDGIADISQAAPHPSRDLVACTVTLRPEPDDDARRSVVLVEDGSHRTLLGDSVSGVSGSPVWSPDGTRLCVVAARGDALAGPVVLTADGEELARAGDLGGATERVRWSPDGRRVAAVVAEPGAEISDVWGSGTVGGGTAESWRPLVQPAEGGRRRLVVWDPASGGHRVLTRLNVWEADWLGDDLVALVTERADEGAWYDARLVRVTADGDVTLLHEETGPGPHRQLEKPAGSPDGRTWSVLTGFASDRDLLAGSLLVGRAGEPPSVVPVPGVDVTDHRWVSPARVLVIGHRGLDTVVAAVDVEDSSCTELWAGRASTGTFQPELGGLDADGCPVLVLEQHDLPPTLVRTKADGRPHTLLGSGGPGTDHVRAALGPTRSVAWSSVDGLAIDGLLDLPHGAGPHPLVVHPHGGPIGAYQDGWIGRDAHTTVLVARGYAVFRPNPRGSAGRGSDFAAAVLGDMGGLDVQDILTGIAHLVDTGVVDPDRVGIVGQSYGGYLACWMPVVSDAFRAAVARSPCTDWRSFHLTTNIPEFDAMFLDGDVWDDGSQYLTRNPLTHHAEISTPILLTAGLRDLATPANQAEQMHRALAARGVPSALALYPEEGHGVQAPPALADQCARMVAWFERFMPVTP